MKHHSFIVNLTFDGKITSDEEIKQLAETIAESLKHTSDTQGIAPDCSETYTTNIEVIPQFLTDAKVTYKLKNATWEKE